MKTKIITCIYSDIYGTELGGRESRKDHYRFSLLSLLKMSDADFVCYTSNREKNDLENFFYTQHNIDRNKIEFIVFDLQSTKHKDLILKYKNIEKTKKSDRCVEIQYSKLNWFENEDKTYDYYFWFDSGLSHTGIIPNKYLSSEGYRGYFESSLFNNKFLQNLINFCEDKFVVISKDNVRNFWDGTVNEKFYTKYDNSLHVIGGMFGGKTELWETIINKFNNYLVEITNNEIINFLQEKQGP